MCSYLTAIWKTKTLSGPDFSQWKGGRPSRRREGIFRGGEQVRNKASYLHPSVVDPSFDRCLKAADLLWHIACGGVLTDTPYQLNHLERATYRESIPAFTHQISKPQTQYVVKLYFVVATSPCNLLQTLSPDTILMHPASQQRSVGKLGAVPKAREPDSRAPSNAQRTTLKRGYKFVAALLDLLSMHCEHRNLEGVAHIVLAKLNCSAPANP